MQLKHLRGSESAEAGQAPSLLGYWRQEGVPALSARWTAGTRLQAGSLSCHQHSAGRDGAAKPRRPQLRDSSCLPADVRDEEQGPMSPSVKATNKGLKTSP